MPIPTPREGEDKNGFISRCTKKLIGEGRGQKQAVAICYKQWNNRGMKSYSKNEQENYPTVAFALVNDYGQQLLHHNIKVINGGDNKSVDKTLLRKALREVGISEGTAQEKSMARSHLQKHARALLPSYGKYVYNMLDNLITGDKMFRFFSKETDSAESTYRFKGNVIEGVEVFRTGVFRGNLFDESYLDALVDHFHLLRGDDKFRDVPIRIDHPDMFGLKNRMNSVCGYVVNLYKEETGKKIKVKYNSYNDEGEELEVVNTIPDIRLVADMEITEPDAFEKIKRTTFRNRSVELGAFADNDGNEYDPVFMGVAWVDIPQVDKLNSLFSKNMKVEELNREDFEKEAEEEKDKVVDIKAEGEVADDGKIEAEAQKVIDEKEKTEEKEDVTDTDAEGTLEEDLKEEEAVEDKKEEVVVEKKQEETVSKMEYLELQKKVETFEMDKRLEQLEQFVSGQKSTPALFELESKLVKSFFAVEGNDNYLSPLQQFELLLEIKTSTPQLWEKKDDIAQVDDSGEKGKAKEEYNMVKPSDEDVKNYAKKLVADAGLNK